ncbi:MAG: helix-turn-helix domain-containing protein [Myxococcales bacterium]|nr:helix-turn-helix domain-containing protein [Myxococcales bacterium]
MSFTLASPTDVQRDLAARAKARRLALGFTQQAAAERAGMSLSSLKRFERTGEVALSSLLRLALVLDALGEFGHLFEPSEDRTLDDVLAEGRRKRGWRA